MIVGPSEQDLIRVYKCSKCGGIFMAQTGPMVSCCVQHAPGSCCHYMEPTVTEEAVAQAKAMLEERDV